MSIQVIPDTGSLNLTIEDGVPKINDLTIPEAFEKVGIVPTPDIFLLRPGHGLNPTRNAEKPCGCLLGMVVCLNHGGWEQAWKWFCGNGGQPYKENIAEESGAELLALAHMESGFMHEAHGVTDPEGSRKNRGNYLAAYDFGILAFQAIKDRAVVESDNHDDDDGNDDDD